MTHIHCCTCILPSKRRKWRVGKNKFVPWNKQYFDQNVTKLTFIFWQNEHGFEHKMNIVFLTKNNWKNWHFLQRPNEQRSGSGRWKKCKGPQCLILAKGWHFGPGSFFNLPVRQEVPQVGCSVVSYDELIQRYLRTPVVLHLVDGLLSLRFCHVPPPDLLDEAGWRVVRMVREVEVGSAFRCLLIGGGLEGHLVRCT